MRRAYQNRGFSEHPTDIVLQSWRQSSRQQKIDLIQRSVGAAADLLAMFYEKGLSYSSINTVRCALSAILDPYGASRTTFCQHPDIKRFMKDIFQCRSPAPGKNKTWDVNIVLQCIISMDDSTYQSKTLP
ncbi:hypothetical protein P5673_020794 [Acropora cervicornis]|uniref:Uncharacterized protein n=1 Tax=Acropora cervicornis TaxID=6130 RepID=A0AAD9Q920_ACRCE|nr:hypothetical protein P5673_020794 [Acropora cervicornis]